MEHIEREDEVETAEVAIQLVASPTRNSARLAKVRLARWMYGSLTSIPT
jgi:hypothetical protein